MFCQNCGKPVPEDSRFCQHCGTSIAGTTTALPEQSEVKSDRSSNPSRKQIIIGLVGILVLTAVCSPLVLIGRNEILNSLLNSEQRNFSEGTNRESRDFTESDPSNSDINQETSNNSESNVVPTQQITISPTATQEGIQVTMLTGNAMGFSQPPEVVIYADNQAGNPPSGVQLAPFCQNGCFRYNGWLGLVTPGDSYDVIFSEPTSSIGVQFWGDPGDGIAHVFVDGKLVWEGDTEGTDVNYPGGAFVNYLQIDNLPLIANHALRIETDPAGGAVTMYFFGSGSAIP